MNYFVVTTAMLNLVFTVFFLIHGNKQRIKRRGGGTRKVNFKFMQELNFIKKKKNWAKNHKKIFQNPGRSFFFPHRLDGLNSFKWPSFLT